MTALAKIGIDVSKDKLDVDVSWNNRHRAKQVANTEAGIASLVQWLTKIGVTQGHACLEATGRYGERVALTLHEAGYVVSVVNPFQIKNFARVRLGRNKTDRLDAALIRDYCERIDPPAWTPPTPAERQLKELVRLREALIVSRGEWSNRRDAGGTSKAATAAMDRTIAVLDEQIAAIEAEIRTLIEGDPDLKTRHDLLVSIPGVATVTAGTVLAELPDVANLDSARHAVSYVGLNPALFTSGTSVQRQPHISRIGNATLRRALYMPAMVAMRYNPLVAALCQRLRDKGRLKPKQIIVAAMRKLLHLCYGVLKTRAAFDPEWEDNKHVLAHAI